MTASRSAYRTLRISDRITLLQEAGLANFMRCNIWHVRGRDFDLVIDTGMGLSPLKQWIAAEAGHPVKAVVTHCHFDHMGGLHEFDCRLGHPAEAAIMARPDPSRVVYSGAWTQIEIVDSRLHPDFSPQRFRISPAPLTGYLDEGDVIDLGDCAFQVLHLPGHSPGSIGLYDVKAKTLFSGDALYDGELLDNLYHSDPATYRQTLERLLSLDAERYHAGHFPSFGKERMRQLVQSYLAGHNRITDVVQWFENQRGRGVDIYADQDWHRAEII